MSIIIDGKRIPRNDPVFCEGYSRGHNRGFAHGYNDAREEECESIIDAMNLDHVSEFLSMHLHKPSFKHQVIEMIEYLQIEEKNCIIDNLIRSFKSAVELLSEKICTCDDEKMCPTCQMCMQLTWWIVSQAPGVTGHPDAGEDDD